MLKHHARMDDTVLNKKGLVLFKLIFLNVLKCDPNLTKKGTKNYAKQSYFLLRVLRLSLVASRIRFSPGAFLATELLSCRDFVHGI